jgi:hypothetical protein
MAAATTIRDARRFMVEFLGRSSAFGILPVSNVVLPSIFGDRSAGAAASSFSFQEAVAVPRAYDGADLPWSLVDPSQIAAYINFLRCDVVKYRHDKPIKALKRAVSLAATIRLFEFVNEGLDILTSAQTRAYIERTRDKEIRAWLARCGDAERARIMPQLLSAEPHGLPADDEVDFVEERGRSYIVKFLHGLEALDRAAA